MSRTNNNRRPSSQRAPLSSQYSRRDSGVLGANHQYNRANQQQQQNNGANQQYNDQDQNDDYDYRSRYNNNPRRRTFYNQNHRPQRYYDNRNNNNRYRSPQRPSNQNRPRSRSFGNPNNNPNNNRYRSPRRPANQNRQQRTRGPRQVILNDYMPTQLRNDFHLATTTTTTAPANALPQRPNLAAAVDNNTTQPFIVNRANQNNRQQIATSTTTTSSHRRRQRRNQQQQHRQYQNNNNNRFAIFTDNGNNNDDIESNYDDNDDIQPLPIRTKNNNNNRNKNKNKTKSRFYLQNNRILKWFNDDISLQNMIKNDGNQAFILASTPIYDEWVRTSYELQIWQNYLKLGLEQKHWAKEVVQRTKRRDDTDNSRFVNKKINYFTSQTAQLSATITDLQIQLSHYWSHNPSNKQQPVPTPTVATTNPVEPVNIIDMNDIDKIKNSVLDYVKYCTQHVRKSAEIRTQLVQAQMNEFKALEDFQQSATPLHWLIHCTLKPKIKFWSIKDKNYQTAQKRVLYDLPPKFIANYNFSFKVDESLYSPENAQLIYNDMCRITSEHRTNCMKLYVQAAEGELELITAEIDELLKSFPRTNDEEEISSDAFLQYHQLRRTASRGRKQQRTKQQKRNKCPDSSTRITQGFLAPNIINEAQIKLTEDEYQLLKLGPRFIFNDPQTASRRQITELATLRRKIETRFYEKKVSPGRPVQQFIAELDIMLQNLHNIRTNPHRTPNLNLTQRLNIRSSKNKLNYNRLVKRLKHKFRIANTLLRKTDKSKVFHLGTIEHYEKRSEEYMNKTKAYTCLGRQNPLPDLIIRTNKYLFDLRLAKWITQKQYEQLCIKPDEVELAHLYYLPKAHKPGTPLRPIISGLQHPTIKISKFLDNLLRPLFDQMALVTTITSGFELIKQLQAWSIVNMKQETLLCTIDVADLYTMIPQTEGVLSLRKMLDHLKLKQINGLKTEVIIRLARFVMQNNYFTYNGLFYHQIRGGAMGSPLTLTIANCYMFFFERNIVRQINNSHGLYLRYIDDLFIIINWPIRHLMKQVDRWNKFDSNIHLSANISFHVDFLDLHMANQDGTLCTKVYQKPSYEPYYLPFNSVHPLHMKKNIPFTMLLRAIRYCSTFQTYLDERAKLRMALLLNKYPGEFINQQFNRLLHQFKIHQPFTTSNYNTLRQRVIDTPYQEKVPIDYAKTMFVHFTYCANMQTFPAKFHTLWNQYFGESPINEIIPILGTRNVDNLQRRLVHTRQS